MLNNNISLEDYHALPAMSAHNLMDVEDNPRIAEYNKAHHQKATAAMVNGTLIHTAIETKDIGKYYACEPPDINKRTNAGKQQLLDFQEAIGDKIPITEKQWEMAESCMDAAWSHPVAREYLEAAKFELSGFITIRGVEVKARPDLDNYESHRTLVDIKSRQKGAANVDKWLRDWWNYKTYIQAGLQLLVWEEMGRPCEHYYYLLVEVAEPYQVHMVYMNAELISLAKQKTIDVIIKWEKWLSNGKRDLGYGEPQAMEALPWMRNQHQTL
jgi:hypothetical protein